MANWTRIRGDWGTHVADVPLADAWHAEWMRRFDVARPLVALGSTTPWGEQRAAVVAAWQAAGNYYRAANVSPPSDPLYRRTFRDWYGDCRALPADLRAYHVGALVSLGGGNMSRALDAIWHTIKPGGDTAPRVFANTAVRLSLAWDGSTVSTCLEATGPEDCDYRGLFTGCADTRNPARVPFGGVPQLSIAGGYREVDCASPYGADSFEWYDGPPQARYSPPLRLSLDVLSDLHAAVMARGGALETIDAARSFVLVSNLSNAALANVLPADLAREAIGLAAEAQRQSTGMNPTQSLVLSGIAIGTAACAEVAGPFAPACAVVGGIAAVIATIWPSAVGVPVDSLGMPMLDPRQSAAFLSQMIAIPSDAGAMSLDVPNVPGVPGAKSYERVFAPAQVDVSRFRANVDTSAAARAVERGTTKSASQRIETAGGSSMLLVGALLVGALVLSKGKL